MCFKKNKTEDELNISTVEDELNENKTEENNEEDKSNENKKEKIDKFLYEEFDYSAIKKNPTFDLSCIYEKCIEELTLQQSKRDQIITIYLAICSFVVTYVLLSSAFNVLIKGMVLFAIALIGLGFSLIITRYRIYKEAYWICCQTITNLMSIKEERFDKPTIQSLYFKCLKKRGKDYVICENNKRKFNHKLFFKKNIFSGETIYSLIHSFIVSTVTGLSAYMLTSLVFGEIAGIILAVVIYFGIFIWQIYVYFKNLKEIYSVLVDKKDSSFNKAFSKAWFLHLYIENDSKNNSATENTAKENA